MRSGGRPRAGARGSGRVGRAGEYASVMDQFHYRDGELQCESVRLAALAADVGTPTYVYSAATLVAHLRRFSEAFAPLNPLVCFSVKCCSNLGVLRTLARCGAGMDVVSGGELHRARLAGVDPERIVFAGVGKTDAEIRDALGAGPAPSPAAGATGGAMTPLPPVRGADRPIGLFNVESEQELHVLAGHARSLGVVVNAALRVNPGVKAGGHDYISTGTETSKFGVDLQSAPNILERFGRDKHVRLTGVHVHIGSGILQPEPYVEAVRRCLALVDDVARRGVRVEVLDIGGGFGADYRTGDAPEAGAYARALVPLLQPRVEAGLRIVAEPGRLIAANAGVLLTRVLYVKQSPAKKFVVCDAGMNTLIRPSLYDAFHFIWPASVSPHHEPPRRGEEPDVPGLEKADVVGPICESGDFLAKDRPLPPVARGDVLAVFAAGAYGMTMASRYNSHPLPAEVLVDGEQVTVVRRRETYADLVAHER